MSVETRTIQCVECKPDIPCIMIVNILANEHGYCPVSGGNCDWVEIELQKRSCQHCGHSEKAWHSQDCCQPCFERMEDECG